MRQLMRDFVVRAREEDDAHYAAAAHHAHLRAYPVGLAPVDDDKVVDLGDGVGRDGRGDEAEAVEGPPLLLVERQGVLALALEYLPQLGHLTLQHDVARREVAVHLAQAHIRGQIGVDLVESCRELVGRGEPYAGLIVVELEEQDSPRALQQQEYYPVEMVLQKLYQIVHSSGLRLTGSLKVRQQSRLGCGLLS